MSTTTTDAAFERLAVYDRPSGGTAPLSRSRVPRHLPPRRWPAWADRVAEHPRACWTITAVCTAASAVLLGIMVTGGLHPVTDWNGPPGLKPEVAAPTIAADPFTAPPTPQPRG